MMAVFNEKNPILAFNKQRTESERNIQEGRKFIFAGSIMSIRNPDAHDNTELKDPARAAKYICLASTLSEFLDEI